MKHSLLLIACLILSSNIYAQQGINYKALIKDTNGNVVANDLVVMQFSIIKTAENGQLVYQETHTPTTDNNGMIALIIGSETPTIGDFATISWSSDVHFLNVQINTGNGLVDLGTTQFMAVPYAINSKTADNIGLEPLDEGNGIGYRIKGRSPFNYGDIGLDAVDFSQSINSSTTKGATGEKSVAMGINTSASEFASTAMGSNNTASGQISTALGLSTTASGSVATAMGSSTEASGENSTAMGFNTEASGDASSASGSGTEASGQYSTTMGLNTTASGFSSTAMGRNTVASASESVAIGSGTEASGSGSLAMGSNTEASGTYSMATGDQTSASAIRAVAMGFGSVASGENSTALGRGTEASGIESTAIGRNTEASGGISTAMGSSTIASGFISTAIGNETEAPSFAEIAIGSNNTTYVPNSETSWNSEDRLLVVGNSTNEFVKSDAFMILKNGTITAPSFDIAEIIDDKALITKEYLEANGSSGLEALDEGNGIGYRIKGRNPDNYGDIGLGAIDLSSSIDPSTTIGATGERSIALGSITTASGFISTAMGSATTASGFLSTAIGRLTEASGAYSTAIGESTIASGINSTALGNSTTASGNDSTAMGNSTTASGASSTATGVNSNASGDISTAMGSNTEAPSFVETAIGRYNTDYTPNSQTFWDDQDRLFVVGNGTGSSSRSDAFTIRKDGQHTMKRTNSTPVHLVLGGYSSSAAGDDGIISSDPKYTGSDIFLRTYDALVVQLDFDDNENGQFEIKAGDGTEVFEVRETGDATLAGSLTQNSDRRLKKDITTLSYGLSEVLALAPKSYHWKKDKEHTNKSLGFIAQDLRSVIPEIVHTAKDEDKTLSVSYTELIPVLVNAIQELKEDNDQLKARIENLEQNNN